MDFAQLSANFERSLIIKLPIALHWAITPSHEFIQWCEGQRTLDERSFFSAPPVAPAQDVAVIRALPFLVELHVSGPSFLREQDWNCLWSGEHQLQASCRVQEITMTLRQDQRCWMRGADFTPLDHFPPSLLRYSRHLSFEEFAFWRSLPDQPWIKLKVDFSERWVSLELYELQPPPLPYTGTPIKACALIGTGRFQIDHRSLVTILRSCLSLDALMIHRGADELNGLKTMARCIAESIAVDPVFPIRLEA